MGVIIKSFGHYIPDHRISNAELAQRFDVTEKYIADKTGIVERTYNTEGATSDMIVKAALVCLDAAKLKPEEVECVLVATMTPDYYCPSTASVVHQKLGTRNAAGFDIMAACSGYLYALQLADALIRTKEYKNVLLCAAEQYSSVIDPMDRKTSLIFSDGAGVSLLEYSEDDDDIMDTICRLDSTDNLDVNILIGGSTTPVTADNVNDGNRFVRFTSRHILDNGVVLFSKVILELLKRNNLSFEQLDYIVLHQANKIMMEKTAAALGLPIEKFIINIEHIGNTGAASIPVAIAQAFESGKLQGGEKILAASVGAGFTYGAALINLVKR